MDKRHKIHFLYYSMNYEESLEIELENEMDKKAEKNAFTIVSIDITISEEGTDILHMKFIKIYKKADSSLS